MVPKRLVHDVLADVDAFAGLVSRDGRLRSGQMLPPAIRKLGTFGQSIEVSLAGLAREPVKHNLRDLSRVPGPQSDGALRMVSVSRDMQLDNIPGEGVGRWTRVREAWVETASEGSGPTEPV